MRQISDMHVSAVLRRQVESRPEAPFLISGDRSLSYGEVAAEARALACALQKLGVERGDRVGIDLPNWPEFVTATLASAELGATVVPLNPGYSPRELQFVLRNTEATAVVTAERYRDTDYLELFEGLLGDLPSLQYLVTVGEEDLWYDDRIFQYEDLVSSGRGRELAPPEISPARDPLAILYTSGTTGEQKGVTLSHANLLVTAGRTAEALGLTPADVTLCSVPLFNIFGLSAALLSVLMSGSSLVLQEHFDPAGALELIRRHRVSVYHGVPTMFVLLAREAESRGADVASLRTGIIAGAPVAPDLVERLRRELIPDLEIAYGLTETSPTLSITVPSDPREARSTSVGRLLEGVEARVLGEQGEALPVGTIGELAVRGPGVMLGYFRQPAASAATFTPDGFFRTGDLAIFDKEGYLHIVGRKGAVIIRGGYNIHPREVEDHLRSHPAVEDAVVIGVPDEVLGEQLCACVVPTEGAIITEVELREFCRSALARFKVPDLVRFFDEFPMTPSGKARRAELGRLVRANPSAHASARAEEDGSAGPADGAAGGVSERD